MLHNHIAMDNAKWLIMSGGPNLLIGSFPS